MTVPAKIKQCRLRAELATITANYKQWKSPHLGRRIIIYKYNMIWHFLKKALKLTESHFSFFDNDEHVSKYSKWSKSFDVQMETICVKFSKQWYSMKFFHTAIWL